MSLSDELLARPPSLAHVRGILAGLVSELEARSAFLVDEDGRPFAALGNVEFQYPDPLPRTGEWGVSLLKALLGEPEETVLSICLIHRVGSRALLVVLFHQALAGRRRRRARGRLKRVAAEISSYLDTLSAN
ncbi:MAG: hypothetical protein ACE5JI_06040 [Acidobacteriota bacterium]